MSRSACSWTAYEWHHYSMHMWEIAFKVDLNDPHLLILTSLCNLPLNVAGMWACFSCIEHSRSDVMFLPRLNHKRVDSFSLWLFPLAQSDEASCHVVSYFMERPTCRGTAVGVSVCENNSGNKNEWTWNASFSAEPQYDCSRGHTLMAARERSWARDNQPICACIPSLQKSWDNK